jgi:hypothetical protein
VVHLASNNHTRFVYNRGTYSACSAPRLEVASVSWVHPMRRRPFLYSFLRLLI